MEPESLERISSIEPTPLIGPGYNYSTVTDKISAIVLTRKTPRTWIIGFGISFALFLLLNFAILHLFLSGVGIWGIRIPVAWGWAIVNFVWWVGIAHAGTLISAILLLMHQEWRTSINRFAEAMTLFAVACAGMFPLLHLGRPWLFYWLFPYPNTMKVWPQFRSPLVWDVFAVSTYATVSFIFWFTGLIPDLATLRDRAKRRVAQVVYGILAMGWRGSASHWKRYETAYLLLAGLATPLVVSVHSVVSFDFAVGVIPGWHSSIFPPYFVAGAIFSGFAMVLTISIPVRKFYGLEDFITERHLDNMAKILLATGLIVGYGYLMETFMAFYGTSIYDKAMIMDRMTGHYMKYYWLVLFCNVGVPQFLWSPKIRRNVPALFVISILVNLGMWLERYIIIVQSLAHDFMPSAWLNYSGTRWDVMTYIGSLGLFLTLLFLFLRYLPMISIFELRQLVSHEEKAASSGAAEAPAGGSA